MTALEKLYDIDRFVDMRAPGYSARVAQATHWPSGQDVAFKVLRPEHLRDARVWDQFAVEVELFTILQHTHTIVQMVDCGYVSDGRDERPAGGEILSCGRESEWFRAELPSRLSQGWRPYIALELLPAEHCLLNLVLGADGEGRRPLRMPTEEGIGLALQFAEFMCEAHALDVVVRDHKPEHAYWDGQRLRVIDLNVSRFLGSDLSPEVRQAEKHKDLRQLAAGVLYTVFTGRDFRYQDQAPQAAPSDPDRVEARFNGTVRVDFGREDPLLAALGRLLSEFVAGDASSASAAALLERLRQLAAVIGWDVGYPVSDESRAARREMQQGLAALKRAQADIEKARQHFLQASALNPNDRDGERLYREATDFLRQRPLP